MAMRCDERWCQTIVVLGVLDEVSVLRGRVRCIPRLGEHADYSLPTFIVRAFLQSLGRWEVNLRSAPASVGRKWAHSTLVRQPGFV